MLRPTKAQAVKIVTEQSSILLEVFRDFQSSNYGWLVFPDKLLEMKKNLKADNYVLLYQDQKYIDASFALAFMGKEAFLEWNEDLKGLSLEEQQQYIVEHTQDLIDMDLSDLEKHLPYLHLTKQEEETNKSAFDALPEPDKAEMIQRAQFFVQFIFASIHNYFSIMVCGEALTSLVPKAIEGDDIAYCKAVKIDRTLIISHPYFVERYKKAQSSGQKEFLAKVTRPQTTPGLIGKISYPGLYAVFSMLESVRWLDDLSHEEILDICDAAELNRYQNRIEDVNYLSKRLKGYRQYQKTGGVSMHSN